MTPEPNNHHHPDDDDLIEEIDVDTLTTTLAFASTTAAAGTTTTASPTSVPPTTKTSSIPHHNHKQKAPVCPLWTRFTEDFVHVGIRRTIVALATHAAQHPVAWVVSSVVFSLAIVAIGFATNFETEFDQKVFLLPTGSLAEQHSRWIQQTFPQTRLLEVLLHAHSDNVLTAQGLRQAMQVMTVIANTQGLADLCPPPRGCRNFTVTQFWNHSPAVLEDALRPFTTREQEEEYIQKTVSVNTYPNTIIPVFHQAILGNYHNQTTTVLDHDDNNNATTTWTLTSAQSLLIRMEIPDVGSQTDQFEKHFLHAMNELRLQYQSNNKDNNNNNNNTTLHSLQLEYFTLNTINTEFQRAMNRDLPLVLVLIVVMMSFTCLVYYRHQETVHSHALLGLFGFCTIGCSLMSGYGIMFLVGVPMTSVGIMVPFVVTGVALDDTFIITGAYFRHQRENQAKPKRQRKDTVTIIQETMHEVAVSITMTTCTTLVCFLLGSPSSIPGVRWLCYYAATTVAVDFFYQVTLFIALLKLDDMRVQDNRRDMCFWIVIPKPVEDDDNDEKEEVRDHAIDGEKILEEAAKEQAIDDKQEGAREIATEITAFPPPEFTDMNPNFVERFMKWYAEKLLHPWVQAFVLVFFFAYFAGCSYSTTLLRQEFDVKDFVPSDSNVAGYLVSVAEYTSFLRFVTVYFRNEDQSDSNIQEQMTNFVNDISEMEPIGEPPDFFWLWDFEQLSSNGQLEELGIELDDLTFNQQIDLALSVPAIDQIYGQDIVRDEQSGNITASRTFLYLRDLDFTNIQAQIDMLQDQEEITNAQPINAPENQKNGELSFFTFDEMYLFWELYSVTVGELIGNSISCVVAVAVITLLFIPHWTAILFVTPLIIVLYLMLLGTMQYCGLKINAITYFIMVTAIGLLVDFLMHVLLRYYETKANTRRQRVRNALEDMGTSIFLGGFTTWLGVLPLALSSTHVFMMVFIGFIAMVTIGCSVGLAFLPVLLSILGPMNDIRHALTDNQLSEKPHGQGLTKSQASSEADFVHFTLEVEC